MSTPNDSALVMDIPQTADLKLPPDRSNHGDRFGLMLLLSLSCTFESVSADLYSSKHRSAGTLAESEGFL